MKGQWAMYSPYAGSDYLRTVANSPAIKKIKQRGHELLRIQPGDRVLDIGSGPGLDTGEIARLVGPGGQVVGIDYDPKMVAEANQEAVREGVSGWTIHQVADSAVLPFATAHFNACYSERVFQHLPPPKPAQTLAEAARVTKPGGWIAVADTDWGTLSVDTDEVDIERRIVRTHAQRFNNGYAGRQLYRLFRQQGLNKVTVELFPVPLTYAGVEYLLTPSEQVAVTIGVITPAEWYRWKVSLAQSEAYGIFFAQLVIVIGVGQKSKTETSYQSSPDQTRDDKE
jgi:ubiquinone/menaquinone biosynthesis C-methylase UbiE